MAGRLLVVLASSQKHKERRGRMRGRPKGHITAPMSPPRDPLAGEGHVQVAAEPLLTRLPVTCQSYFWNVETGSERRREAGSARKGAGKLRVVGGQLHALPPPL